MVFPLQKKLCITGLISNTASCFKMVRSQATPQATANPIIINLPPIDPNHEKEKIKKSFPKRSILQNICGCLEVFFQVKL